jgi:CubicO group peptidase (beta-lactamase class C family)
MDLPQSREPEQIGFDPGRLERAYRLLRVWTDAGRLPAAAICVGRRGGIVPPKVFGRLDSKPGAKPAGPDTLFLIASITKPVTVTAVMMLVARGEVALDDPVSRVVPDFARNGKGDVRLRHLMTHTSGLPDMLPNNRALREAHAPLERFIEETNRLPLLFPPGTRVSYQSMGIAVLAEVVHQVTGVTLSEFLRREVFEPLGMTDTSLGWDPGKKERIARVRLEPEQEATDWNWNTPYWLGFGAPWGGLITSPGDFARFCRLLLQGGTFDGVRLLAPATVRAMTSNQLAAMPLVPEAERRCRPWGLGWRLNWPGNTGSFGDLLGPRTYGHWGATGTLCWLDPDTDAFMVLFTTQPGGDENRELALVSNAVAAALV